MARVLIVGAGAAGLMAAIFAAGAGRDVLILERMAAPGRKILISGGGRCNVLPSQVEATQFHSDSSPHSLRKILDSWPLAEQRHFFEETLGVPLKLEAESGKLFPQSNRAADVLQALLDEAARRGARLRTHASVEGLARAESGWQLRLAGGETLGADAVVLATGGCSIPKTGSDGTGLRLVRALGHKLHPLYPALTPLLTQNGAHHALAGLSLSVTLVAPLGHSIKKGTQTHGGFLFTHRGYSGPSVLDLSHHATRAAGPGAQPLWVQWAALDAEGWERLLRDGPATTPLRPLLRERLPNRLADLLLDEAEVRATTLAELRRDERQRLVTLLARYPLPYSGDEGYKKAEVTGGGVALNEVDPATLESRRHPALFLCGEMLDAFGPIGGYNFLWAWATGRLAGRGAAGM